MLYCLFKTQYFLFFSHIHQKQLEQEKPWLNERIMSHWEQHLTSADRWISEMSTGSVRVRVLKLMRFLMELNAAIRTGEVLFWGFVILIGVIVLLFLKGALECNWKIEQLEREKY